MSCRLATRYSTTIPPAPDCRLRQPEAPDAHTAHVLSRRLAGLPRGDDRDLVAGSDERLGLPAGPHIARIAIVLEQHHDVAAAGPSCTDRGHPPSASMNIDSSSAAARRTSNSATTFSRPRRPISRRKPSDAASCRRASAIRSARPGATTKPLTPSSTSSGIPAILRRHDRQLHRHRLHEHDGNALREARQDEDVGFDEVRADVVLADRADDVHPRQRCRACARAR